MIRICLVILIAVTILDAEVPFQGYYDSQNKEKLLYLHNLVNYNFSPKWYFKYDNNFFSRNSIMFSFGSVETEDLHSDFNLHLNQMLSKSLFFTYRARKYESQSLQKPIQSGYLGLEQKLYKFFKVFLSANPAFNKEDIDLELGLRIINQNRQNYLSVAISMDDFVYDEKNDLGGSSEFEQLGIHWITRYELDEFSLFSEGIMPSGFKRTYPDPAKSSEITYHQQLIRQSHTRFYIKQKNNSLLLTGYQYYYFEEKKRFYQSGFNYDFYNAFHNFYLDYFLSFSDNFSGRIIGRYVYQESFSRVFKHYDYYRQEFMPALFIEYHLSRMSWELGWMESFYQWENTARPNINSYERNNIIEKIKLGWSWNFSEDSCLQLSLSHVISVFGFGGANIQMMHFF